LSWDKSEFFVRGIGNLVGCILNRLFRVTGELFTLAFRPLSEAFGLQLFRAGGLTGCFLDFSRGLIGDARNFVCGATLIHFLTLWLSRSTTLKRKPTKKVPPKMTARNRVHAMPRARTFSRGMDQIADIAKFVDNARR
jgi:hypothetical protein